MRLSASLPSTTAGICLGSTTVAASRNIWMAWVDRPSLQPNLRPSTPDTSSMINGERQSSNRPLRARSSTMRSFPGKFKPETMTLVSRTTLMFGRYRLRPGTLPPRGPLARLQCRDPWPAALRNRADVATHTARCSGCNASRRRSLLDRPCCLITSSTRTAMSAGTEKVMLLVERAICASY